MSGPSKILEFNQESVTEESSLAVNKNNIWTCSNTKVGISFKKYMGISLVVSGQSPKICMDMFTNSNNDLFVIDDKGILFGLMKGSLFNYKWVKIEKDVKWVAFGTNNIGYVLFTNGDIKELIGASIRNQIYKETDSKNKIISISVLTASESNLSLKNKLIAIDTSETINTIENSEKKKISKFYGNEACVDEFNNLFVCSVSTIYLKKPTDKEFDPIAFGPIKKCRCGYGKVWILGSNNVIYSIDVSKLIGIEFKVDLNTSLKSVPSFLNIK